MGGANFNMENPDFTKLLELPLEEYQKELGILLAAAISIAAEERPGYERRLQDIKKSDEARRTVVVK